VLEIRSIEESKSLAVFDFQCETFPHTKTIFSKEGIDIINELGLQSIELML
jgi:hypothetical protein